MTADRTPSEPQAVVHIDRLHIDGLAAAQVDAFSTALADELTQLAKRGIPLPSAIDATVIPALRITAPVNSRPADLARLVAKSLHDRIG